jgi:hypothetical protein
MATPRDAGAMASRLDSQSCVGRIVRLDSLPVNRRASVGKPFVVADVDPGQAPLQCA